jgi:hypothetical protein
MTCSTWEDAKVLQVGEMIGLRREGSYSQMLHRFENDPSCRPARTAASFKSATRVAHTLRYCLSV